MEQLRDEAAIGVILDGSDLRKPHARCMQALQRVKRLHGEGTVPDYCTLTALGVGHQRRGLLSHRLFSSAAPDFTSESAKVQRALTAIGSAVAPLGAEVTSRMDADFDDVAVWGAIWQQGHHVVYRVRERDRLVRLLRRLGGGEDRPDRPAGKIVLMRGLRRLLDLLVTETILADEIRQHGSVPPRLAALLGRSPTG